MSGDQRILLIALALLVAAIGLVGLFAELAQEGPCADGGGATGCNGELF